MTLLIVFVLRETYSSSAFPQVYTAHPAWSAKGSKSQTRQRKDELMTLILEGKRPDRPEPAQTGGIAMPNVLWDLTQRCWAQDPFVRPSASDLVQFLGRFVSRPS